MPLHKRFSSELEEIKETEEPPKSNREEVGLDPAEIIEVKPLSHYHLKFYDRMKKLKLFIDLKPSMKWFNYNTVKDKQKLLFIKQRSKSGEIALTGDELAAIDEEFKFESAKQDHLSCDFLVEDQREDMLEMVKSQVNKDPQIPKDQFLPFP